MMNQQQLDTYLKEFSEIADDLFQKESWRIERYKFFKELFRPEKLQHLSWNEIQRIGDNLHPTVKNHVLKAQAFSRDRPNHPVEKYRETLQYLVSSTDDIKTKIDNLIGKNAKYKIMWWGESIIQELIGYIFADKYILMNTQSIDALIFLEFDNQYKSGSTIGERFVQFNKTAQPIIDSYKHVVGHRSDMPINLEVDTFLYWLNVTYAQQIDSLSISDDNEIESDGRNVWLYSPGENARYWKENLENGLMAIGWDNLGDLRRYENIDEIEANLKEIYPNGSTDRTMDRLALWEFCNKIQIGDYVIVKKGLQLYVGYGIVEGDYYYDDSRSEYKHTRSVQWIEKGEWKQKQLKQLVSKTLTNISKYPDYCDEIFIQLGIVRAFLLTWNPKVWEWKELDDLAESLQNNGRQANKDAWSVRSYKAIREGDRFYLIRLGEEPRGIVASGRITSTPRLGGHFAEDDKNAYYVNIEYDALLNPKNSILPLSELEKLNKGVKDKMMWTPQASGISIKPNILPLLDNKWKEYLLSIGYPVNKSKPKTATAVKDIFLSEETMQSILDGIIHKKNVILQGPPGVGKTYIAKELAYNVIGERDDDKISVVQFHQSYSYEDFVQGFRPNPEGGFAVRDGILLRFSAKAMSDPGNKYVMIIDEFNRGNVAKIFGELLSLIEGDKRTSEYALSLTYSEDSSSFHLPDNLYFIGLMNTADRSLAIVDYALRRRFAFYDIEPQFNDKFKRHLVSQVGVEPSFANAVAEKMKSLNTSIRNDAELGHGFMLGHSYFCHPDNRRTPNVWYQSIIDHEIMHLLKEYWFDKPERISEELEKLRM